MCEANNETHDRRYEWLSEECKIHSARNTQGTTHRDDKTKKLTLIQVNGISYFLTIEKESVSAGVARR